MQRRRYTLAAALLSASMVMAAGAAPASEDRDERLDRLFAELGNASDEAAARQIEHDIWMTWIEHDDPQVKAMMDEALQRRRWQDLQGALDILDDLVKIAPQFAEAWNQRATVLFSMRAYERSLVDVARALALEPRHFAAMAGRGLIRLHQGKPALAYQNILAAVQIHPYLRERNLLPDTLLPQNNEAPAN